MQLYRAAVLTASTPPAPTVVGCDGTKSGVKTPRLTVVSQLGAVGAVFCLSARPTAIMASADPTRRDQGSALLPFLSLLFAGRPPPERRR